MGKCLRKCKKVVDIPMQTVYYINVRCEHAEVAELADAQASGACDSNIVQVQVLLSAPKHENPNLIRQVVPVGDGFGFLLYL